ncbi:MAG TPA: hypothetical protein VGO07_01935 [Candidatus Saccharimonadales bacterium]|nr:hypothetical protein [Candidatus Saccharimonadales bacterium]
MQNENTNTDVGHVQDGNGQPISPEFDLSSIGMAVNPDALSSDPGALSNPPPDASAPSRKKLLARLFKRANIVTVVVLLLVMTGLLINSVVNKPKSATTANVASEYSTQKIPLGGFIATNQGVTFGPSNVIINGSLQVSDGVVLTPISQPQAATAGQLYYDKNTNQLTYYNGQQYVSLTQQGQVVQNIGGVTGALTLGSGLNIVGNQLSVTQTTQNPGVSSLGGVTGALTVGNGLKITGTDLQNNGIVSLVAGTANLVVTTDDNGNATISNTGAGTGTVTSGGGTVGRIAKFTGVQNVEDSLLSDNGLAVTVNGNLSITGSLALTSALSVANGGTGTNTLTANGVLVGQGGGAITSVTAGGAGLCLISTVGAPSFQACPGGGGVTSLNGLTGGLTIANASGVGSTVTINDATTGAKGIASFNGTNFGVAGGAVNTVQDINTTATPTFGGVNTNTITPSSSFTAGATGQSFKLQGNGLSTLTSTNGGNTTTVSFQPATANVTYRFATTAAGSYDICTTAGNCVGGGGGVTTAGGTNNAIPKFTGLQTLSDSNISDNGSLVTITGNASITGALTLGTALGVGQGGTGVQTLTNNGVVIGQGAGALATVTAGGSGLCFMSTGGAPAFQACPTTGVTSLNGLTGALSIANASAAGSTVTINDATTGAKGIASFNGTNFTVTAGAVNTIQDIATTSAPTFGQLAITSSQASNPMLLVNNTNSGGSGNLLDLQVSGTSKFSVQPNGNTTTTGTINGQTISSSANFTGTLAVAGNSTLTGDIAVNGGDITSAGALNITPGGALTVGAASQTLALQGGSASSFAVTNGGNATTVNFQAPTANVTYRFATAAAGNYDICTTVGNCAGTGGGVTTAGGSTNRLAKFTAGQVIGDSTITDNGTTVATTANLTVQGGTLTAGVANSQTGSLTLAYGSANFSGTITPGALTANRTYTLPDASGTFCLNGASSCGFATGSGAAFVQGGNSFAAAADLGTNDGNALNLRTNGLTRISIGGATGDAAFSGDVAVNGGDITSSGALNITPGGTLTVGDTGQTLALQGGSGTMLKAVNGGNATMVNFQAPTANVTYRFATTGAGTYDVCTTAGNCVGGGGGVTSSGGTTNRLAKFTGTTAVNDSTISDNGTTVTTTANMVIQGGTGTIGVAGTTNGSLTLAYGGAAFSGTINTATLTADRTYTLPDSSGTFCLTSGNCLGGGGGGANTALSNLSSVAINTSLLPGAAGTINLGSATLPFGDLYIAGSSATPGANNFRVTGSATAARTITLPDASGTVCLNGTAACGFATGSGAAFLQNGNTFGAAGNLGTNDSNALNLRTSGTSRITIAANGSDATFASNMDLIMQGATAFITNAQGTGGGEAFGSGATTGDRGVAVGNSAVGNNDGVAIGNNSSNFGGGVAVGARAITSSTAGVAVGTDSNAGYLATALGNSAQAAQEGTALGYSAVVGAHNSVAIGNSATVNQQFSIAIGQAATTTASNQMVIGATGYEIDHIYVGSGVSSATPTSFTLQGTGGNGANVAGADVSIAGGAGTGNANGGNVNIKVATPGISGSAANVPTTVLSLSGVNGSALFKNVVNSTNAFEVQTLGGAPVFTVNTATPGVAVAGATTSTGNINSSAGTLQTASTTRVDNAGNLVNIGNITGSAATAISAAGTLTVGNTGQILALQGNASSTFAVTGGGFTTTVGFSGTPTGAVVYNFDRAATAGTYNICTTAGNCLGGGSGAANTALSNLASVAINTTLLPGAAGTINLGSGTLPFGDFYLAGTSATPGTNNFKITGAATAARTITLPNESGTLCTNAAGSTTCQGNYILNTTTVQSNASIAIQSAADANVTMLLKERATQSADTLRVVDSSNALLFNIDTFGSIHQTNSATFSSFVGIGGASSSGEQLRIVTTTASNIGLNIIAAAGQTADLISVDGNGTKALNYTAGGTLAVTAGSGQTADIFQVLSTTTTPIFQIAGNTTNATLTDNMIILGQAADALTVKSSANGSGVVILNLQQNDNDSVLRVTDTGTLAVGNGTNVTGILSLAKGTGSIFGEIHADNLTASRTLQMPDVSGTICTDAGNCGSATGTLQSAYTFSVGGTTPEIKLDATRNGLDVQDANTTIGSSANFISFRGPNGSGLGNILFGVGTQGNLFVQPSADRTDLFDINNNAGNNVFTIDSATSNGRVGIGLGGSVLPAYTLDVAGDLNLTTGSVYRINGTSICTSSGCTAAAGSNNYIQNQNGGDQTTANFRISGTGQATTSLLTPLLDASSAVPLNIGTTNATAVNLNQNTTVAAGKTLTVTSALTSLTSATTGDALSVSNSTSTGNIAVFKDNATSVVTVGDGGAVLLQNETNQLSALKILTTAASGAHTLFNADTINERVGIGGIATVSKFEVQGGDAAIYNSGNNPRLILGDSTTAGQNGYLQWDSTNDYFRIETAGTNGLKINDNFLTIGNIFPDQPLKVASGTNLLFQVNTAGAATLVGGQAADLAAAAVGTANGTGSALSIAGGSETSNTCGTACIGGALNLVGGSATGSSGTRNGGSVNVDAGTGNTSNGGINIGTVNSSNIIIGKTTGGSSTTVQGGTGGVNIGGGGVANTVQIGNTTSAVAQTINIGTNATASSSSAVTIGSTVAGNLTLQSAATVSIANNATAQTVIVGNTTGATSLSLQSGSTGTTLLSSGNVTIGAADANGTLLVFDTKNTAGDPTGVNGAMYYNSNTDKFRCFQASTWSDCITASGGFVSLQNAYTNSTGGTTPEILVDGTRNGLDIQDNSLTAGALLLAVRATGTPTTLGTALFTVSNSGNVTIAPAAGTTTALAVTQATAANGVDITNSSTGSGETISLTNTSGTQTNGLSINRNGAGGTTTTGLAITNTAGTLPTGLAFTGTIATDIQRSSGTLTIQGASVSVVAAAAGTVTIGTTTAGTANTVNINNATNAGTVSVGSGMTTGTIDIGGSLQTGTIGLGESTDSQTINIGNAQTATAKTLTVNMATSATGTGKALVTIGNTNGASTLTLQAGTGNVALLTTGNVTIGTSDTTGTLLVLDTKTTSGDPTGVAGGMYYNSNLGEFRCYEGDTATAGYWRNCIQNARTGWTYQNEMTTKTSDGTISFTVSGTGALNDGSAFPSTALHPGIMEQTTGTTAAGFSDVGSADANGQSVLLGGGDTWRYETEVQLVTLSNGTDTYVYRAGFNDSPTGNGDATDGCYFRYTDGVNGGKWQGRCDSNGTGNSSVCDTTIAGTAGAWVRLTVVVNAAATSADFQVNGVSKCQVTTNIPTGAGRSTTFMDTFSKTVGTTNVSALIDYIEIQAQFGSSR